MYSIQLLPLFLAAFVWVRHDIPLAAATDDLDIDPCDPNNHTTLDEPHRSTGYKVVYPGKPICDRYLEPGWYRFTSQAGGMMPTHCPKRYQCGTVVPIWMKGSHPTVQDGIVRRKVCGNFNSNRGAGSECCEHSRTIRVLNCGSFYVYKLRPTPSCPIAYCAGKGVPCPQGKWSNSSFPPCEDAYPLMTTPPRLSLPLVNSSSFGFLCEFEFPKQDPNQRFEVTWIFEGQEDSNLDPTEVSDPLREARLDGAALKGHINKNIRCRIRSYFASIGKENSVSPYLESNAYYAGIKISPGEIELGKTEHVKNMTITSTIPILCDHMFECSLLFKLGTAQSDYVSTANACDFALKSHDWDNKTCQASINVSLAVTQDIMGFGNQQALVSFETLLPAGGGRYHDVFIGHVPNSIRVQVQGPKTYQCAITTDPHIRGFDAKSSHLYDLDGDFTAYKVDSDAFEIQFRTWPCGNSFVTCVCGVAIREKDDIIRISQCDQLKGGYGTSPTVQSPSKQLSKGTIIKRSKNTCVIAVYMPSGVQIQIRARPIALNVYITSPGSHEGLARGICGTNDGNSRNEFVRPDGSVDPMCSSSTSCWATSFFKSWQLAPNNKNNLFEYIPPRLNTDTNNHFCKCKKDQKTSAINCEKMKLDNMCHGCHDFSPEFTNDEPGERNKRAAVFEDRDDPDIPYVATSLPSINVSKTWPNANGVTESQASQMCSQALQASKLWSNKDKMDSMTSSILSDCMADILFADSTDFVDMVTDQFTTQCQLELAKDPSNYVSDPSGETIMKPELLTDICSSACDEHGHCGEGGKCVCDDGWEGEVCQINSKKGPQLIKIRSGPVCDNQKRPCKRIFIDASNFEFTENLTCRVQFVDDHGNVEGEHNMTHAIMISGGRISCELPATDASSQDFKMSATTNGQVFGNELGIRVFDSRCLKCDLTNCTLEPYACNINKKCYYDQQTNPTNWREKCDASQHTTEWTNLPRLPFTPHLSGPTTDQPIICTFAPNSDVMGPYKVTWYIDSKELKHTSLTRSRVCLDVSEVPTSGNLTCVIKKNEAYAESNILNYTSTSQKASTFKCHPSPSSSGVITAVIVILPIVFVSFTVALLAYTIPKI